MAIEHLNQNEFETKVLTSKVLVVVDFYADWCEPCKMLGKVLEEIDQEYPNILIAKINVDDNLELCQKFKIMSIPHVKIVKQGKIVDQFIGFQNKAKVCEIINKYMDL